ncbi:hypothetical protein GOP47_0012607 [Adiantum capillus-veneris]|uniref:Cell cycle checkpoint control protein RAD9A n=1 Tax=Adiantum capillus-veneris TaxID=13818 RepID=A0A9D4UR86_ADICA|nr:hypothetical protein GOP47_0012607 [Adiantum capillus-veneris]
MECLLAGNQIKAFHRAVTCLARIGNELLIEALPEKLILRTLNSSRSAYLAISFKAQFFDTYRLLVPVAQCGVLLKAVCTVFRLPPTSMERIAIILPDLAATKLQWTLECLHGIRKSYWITCANDPDMQHVVLDRETFPSRLVVKPCDLTRLLGNFQSSLQEITIIATEASPMSSVGSKTSSDGKAVELRSYIDPIKAENNDGALHTQLWIDPSEELQEYVHQGAAVDVTFSLKELKAFLSFCEGSEADMHVFFEKAGKPILLAPRFGLDDSGQVDFDATLVLATMLGSQLREADNEGAELQAGANPTPPSQLRRSTAQAAAGPQTSAQRMQRMSASAQKSAGEHSDHTKIWSEVSGSATKSWDNRDVAREPAYMQDSNDASEEILVGLQRQQLEQPKDNDVANRTPLSPPLSLSVMRMDPHGSPRQTGSDNALGEPEQIMYHDKNITLNRNPGNWLSANTDHDDDDDEDGDDLCVQSTPPQRRGIF